MAKIHSVMMLDRWQAAASLSVAQALGVSRQDRRVRGDHCVGVGQREDAARANNSRLYNRLKCIPACCLAKRTGSTLDGAKLLARTSIVTHRLTLRPSARLCLNRR